MSINHERLKARRAGSRQSSGWRPRDGANVVRILPPHSRFINNYDEVEDLAVPYKIHFFRVEGRPAEVSRCLQELKQRCPACDMWRMHAKSADVGLAEMAKQISPADQYLFNIFDINNMTAGVQYWASNYTCWNQIMEIAGNAKWGNVIDPADGVDFTVTLTPGTRNRTKRNQYSVTPDPQRTTVMDELQALEGWEATLDALAEQMTPAKTVEEINALLEEIGFPVVAPRAATTAVATRPAAAATRPAPVAAKPAAVATRPAAAATRPAPVAAKPAAARPAAARPRPAPVVEDIEEDASDAGPKVASAAASPAADGAPHYDPGENYVPVVDEADRPEGAPLCFGDYEPKVHDCQPCPFISDCQLKALNF